MTPFTFDLRFRRHCRRVRARDSNLSEETNGATDETRAHDDHDYRPDKGPIVVFDR